MTRSLLSALLTALLTVLVAQPHEAAAQAAYGTTTTTRTTTSTATGTTPPPVTVNPSGALPVPVPALAAPGSVPSTTPAPGAVPGMSAPAVPAQGLAPAGSVVAPAPALPVPQITLAPPAVPSAPFQGEVFGANLFTGAFAREGATQFNPDYAVAVGDQVQLRLWGAFDFDSAVTVDPKGNIFIPHVGPVRVLGVRNQDLQRVVESAVGKSFRNNVNSYASLAAAQPVRIFVGGNVLRPGLYSGTSLDSLLHYLDQAGGIDPARGSFLAIQVKRGTAVRVTVNLYDFLLEGVMPQIQLSSGDVIFVPPRQNSVRVGGLAQHTKYFEFAGDNRTVADLMRLAKPLPMATHVRVIRNTGVVKNTEYYALEEANGVPLLNGDELEFTADKKPGTITVRVQGEHLTPQEYVLPYGTRLGTLLRQIQFSERSDVDSVQLFRTSVQERQREMLATSLKRLEAAALTARSATSDEARLRKEESELLLQWVDRAKSVEPRGQVLIARSSVRDNLLLENGDVLNVPTRDGLVLVSGEVLFPNAIAYEANLSLEDYIRRSGGYTQNADAARIVVAHRDGSFSEGGERGYGTSPAVIRPGDEVLVLPKIDVKSRQIWKDLSQIIFQLAVTAKVAFGL